MVDFLVCWSLYLEETVSFLDFVDFADGNGLWAADKLLMLGVRDLGRKPSL